MPKIVFVLFAITNTGLVLGTSFDKDAVLNRCSLENSFLGSGSANKLNFCQDLKMSQTDRDAALEAYIRSQTDPADELFWANWIRKETLYDKEEQIVVIKDESQSHVMRDFVSSPSDACAAFSFDVRNNEWEEGVVAKADIVNFLYEDGNGYNVEVCVFNCHLSGGGDAALESETCSSLAPLWAGAHDYELVNCATENAEDPSVCRDLQN